MDEVKVYLWEATGDTKLARVKRFLGAGHGALDVPWKGEAFYISWFSDVRADSSASKKGEENRYTGEAAWSTGFEYVWDRKKTRMIPNPYAWHKEADRPKYDKNHNLIMPVTHVPPGSGDPTFKARKAPIGLKTEHLDAYREAAKTDRILAAMRPRKFVGGKLTFELDQSDKPDEWKKIQKLVQNRQQSFLKSLKEDEYGEQYACFANLTSIELAPSGWIKPKPKPGHMTYGRDRAGQEASEAISIPCASKRTGQPATWPEQLWGLSADSIMRWWISLMRLEPGNAQRRYNALSRRNNCDGAVVAGLLHGGGEIFSGSPRNLVQGTNSLKQWANAIKTEVESLERHYLDFKNEVPWLRSRQLLKGIPPFKEWKKFSAVSGKPRVLTCELYEVDALVKEYHQCRDKLQLQDERFDADELAAWTGDTRAVFTLRVKSLRILADIHKQIHKLWRRNPHSSRMPFMLQLYGALIDEVWGGTGMLPQETGKQYRSLVH